MADEEDIEALKSGDHDLVKRDFRGADLSGIELKNRDFSEALLQSADLSRSNLIGSELHKSLTLGMKAEHANFSSVKAISTVFHGVDFSNAILRNADFSRSHFTNVNFSGADFRGTLFQDAVFNADNIFENCIGDETTLFDGASIVRADARNPVFQHYFVERGRLKRRPVEAETVAIPTTQERGRENQVKLVKQEIIDVIDDVLNTLSGLQPEDRGTPEYGGKGHNNPPPDDYPIDIESYQRSIAALNRIRDEMRELEPNKAVVDSATIELIDTSSTMGNWVSQKINLASDEFCKQLGKSLGDAKVWVATWLAVSGQLENLTSLIGKLFGQ